MLLKSFVQELMRKFLPRVNQLHLGCSSLHCASLLHKETVKMTQPIIDLHILGIVNSA